MLTSKSERQEKSHSTASSGTKMTWHHVSILTVGGAGRSWEAEALHKSADYKSERRYVDITTIELSSSSIAAAIER